jgi:hypothetical protein
MSQHPRAISGRRSFAELRSVNYCAATAELTNCFVRRKDGQEAFARSTINGTIDIKIEKGSRSGKSPQRIFSD